MKFTSSDLYTDFIVLSCDITCIIFFTSDYAGEATTTVSRRPSGLRRRTTSQASQSEIDSEIEPENETPAQKKKPRKRVAAATALESSSNDPKRPKAKTIPVRNSPLGNTL